MITESKTKADFRSATESKKAPKAVADGVAGMILAIAVVSGTPEQAFRALTTDEILKISWQALIPVITSQSNVMRVTTHDRSCV